jgi:hypothetical protein
MVQGSMNLPEEYFAKTAYFAKDSGVHCVHPAITLVQKLWAPASEIRKQDTFDTEALVKFWNNQPCLGISWLPILTRSIQGIQDTHHRRARVDKLMPILRQGITARLNPMSTLF